MAFGPAIPGETPIDDISQLLVKDVTTRAELNILELDNVHEAITKYLQSRPSKRTARFDLSWVKKLHYEMFCNVWGWAGQFRTQDVNLGRPWTQIETAVHELLENLKVWPGSHRERAALLHHQAVAIHPFFNGNGRWSRLLANIWLKQHRQPIINWPEASVASASLIRDEYLETIKKADLGEYEPLIQLQQRYMDSL